MTPDIEVPSHRDDIQKRELFAGIPRQISADVSAPFAVPTKIGIHGTCSLFNHNRIKYEIFQRAHKAM